MSPIERRLRSRGLSFPLKVDTGKDDVCDRSDRKKIFSEDYFADKDVLQVHLLAALDDIIERRGFRDILEVGCGTGKLLNALKREGRRVFGCDISDAAARKAGASVADAMRLPYKKKSFDLVIAVSVVEHLTEEEGNMLLDEAFRLLKKGGCFFMVTPNLSSPMRHIKGSRWFGYSDKTHITFYTPKSLAKKMERFGFLDIQSMFSLRSYPDFNWGIPFKTPAALNRFFSWLFIATPLALVRDSFWIMGKCSK